jgi:hypothetical protein
MATVDTGFSNGCLNTEASISLRSRLSADRVRVDFEGRDLSTYRTYAVTSAVDASSGIILAATTSRTDVNGSFRITFDVPRTNWRSGDPVEAFVVEAVTGDAEQCSAGTIKVDISRLAVPATDALPHHAAPQRSSPSPVLLLVGGFVGLLTLWRARFAPTRRGRGPRR